MKRPVFWLLLPVLLMLAADDANPDAANRRQRLRRDGAIIETVVQSSLILAGENDPIKRATCCTSMAQALAAEAGRAAGNHDDGRVAEFGEYLHELLEQGIATNLLSARKRSPAGSAVERKLRPVGAQAAEVVERLEQQLRQLQSGDAQPSLQSTLEQLRAGHSEVEKALKGDR
jgi:hypothetical protein